MWWSDEKIEWYERASEYSSFHKELSLIIENHLEKDESVLELGCGLGHVASILSNTHPVHAIDIEEKPIERAIKREGKNIYYVSDWKDWTKKADAVLCIFFGRLNEEERLQKLFSLAGRHLIYVYSEHKGQRDDLVSHNTPSMAEMSELLKAEGYKAYGERFTLSFPQPLKSLSEAEAFISLSYPGKNVKDYLRYVIPSGNPDYPYILKNEKKLVFFDIMKS